jgi:hypothetical protein
VLRFGYYYFLVIVVVIVTDDKSFLRLPCVHVYVFALFSSVELA